MPVCIQHKHNDNVLFLRFSAASEATKNIFSACTSSYLLKIQNLCISVRAI
uniref:Uncharacterized protein n=1 Tax=Arundo donax TaxID=35708 RepID=A0A0A9AXX8_ARUDO